MASREQQLAEQVQQIVEEQTALAVSVHVWEWECEPGCDDWSRPVYVIVQRKTYGGEDDPLFSHAVCDLDAASIGEQSKFVAEQVLEPFGSVR
jgi:hypothetical protein